MGNQSSVARNDAKKKKAPVDADANASSSHPLKQSMCGLTYSEQASMVSPSSYSSEANECPNPVASNASTMDGGYSSMDGESTTPVGPVAETKPAAKPKPKAAAPSSSSYDGAGGASGTSGSGGSEGASGATSAPVAQAPAKVDDAKVREWIKRGYAQATPGASPQLAAELAFSWLHLQRKSHPNTEVNLAAAEHYMYNRSQVAKGGTGAAILQGALTLGYDIVKGGAQAVGAGKLVSTDGREPSAASVEATEWGMKGVSDGMNDSSQASK